MTQEELAEKIHVSQTWITLIETGKKTPNLRLLQKIAQAIGVKAKDLLPF
jgi:DNA-binding XRE family transcriptional regulator